MKKSHAYLPGLILATSAIFTSCQKDDVLSPEKNIETENVSAKKSNCFATGFNVSYGDGNRIVFKSQQLTNNGKSVHINAGMYQGGTITQTLSLDVKRSGKTVTVYKAGSTTDVVLIITLNNNKKPVQVVAGNTPDHNFLPTDFEYTNNRLSSMKILLAGKQTVSNFNYANGNIVSIVDEATSGLTPARIEYEYDLAKSASKQMYLEEARKFSWNTFTLLQYLGYFPELDPTHLRTRTKVLWENNYPAMDARLVNHQVENGKLVRYDLTYSGSNVSIPHEIEWQCSDIINDDEDDQ